MGTTLTMALVLWPVLYVAHVGDTRCYLLRSAQLKRLTTDHTMAQKLVANATEPVDVASQLHHTLWNSLGGSAELPKPEIAKLELELGDVLMLCSDGLTKHVTDEEIAAASVSGRAECCALRKVRGARQRRRWLRQRDGRGCGRTSGAGSARRARLSSLQNGARKPCCGARQLMGG